MYVLCFMQFFASKDECGIFLVISAISHCLYSQVRLYVVQTNCVYASHASKPNLYSPLAPNTHGLIKTAQLVRCCITLVVNIRCAGQFKNV